MKKINKKQVNNFLTVLAIIGLVLSGIAGTLGYQSFISSTKAQGVAEFKVNACDPYANDKGQKWLECDE